MKSKSNPFLRSSLLLATIVFTAGAGCLHAAVADWSSTAATTAWATATNWVSGAAPAAGDSARFNQLAYVSQPNYGTATIAGLTFGDGTTVTAASTLTGATLTLGGDIVVSANAGAVSIGGTNPIKWASKNATNSSANELVISAGITSQGTGGATTFGFNGTGKVLASGPISNGGGTNKVSINKTSSGTLTLSGTNTFSGGLTLGGANSGSQLNINSATALGATASTLTINGGDNAKIDNTSGAAITIANNNPQTWTNNFTFVGSNDLNMGTGTITLVGGNRTITANAKTLTLGGVITDGTGTYSLTKAGTGTVVLTKANTYDGTTTVNAGYLRPTNANALGSATGGTVAGVGTNGAGTIELTDGLTSNPAETITVSGSGTEFFGALRAGTGGGTWAGQITIGANGARLGATTGNTLTVTGSIVNGTGSSFGISGQSGTGKVILNPTTSNTYTGNTEIIRGILQLSKSDALPTGTMLDVDAASGVADPAVFDLAGFNQTTGGLRDGATSSFSGIVTNSAASTTSILTLNQTENTFYEGIIADGANAGVVALVKNGTGTLELNGVNTYTGTTSVNAGRLNVGGSLISPVTIASGASLGGEGSISGALTFSAGESAIVFNPGTTEALTVTSLETTGATIRISPSGEVVEGTDYIVLKNNDFTGIALTTFASGARGALAYSTDNKELVFTAGTALTTPLVWKGNATTNPTFWDVNTTANWSNGTSSDKFFSFDSVSFDDSASTGNVAVQGTSLAVGPISFNNNSVNYSLSGGALSGTSDLTKSGTGSLTLANANTYTGNTILNAGTLNLNHASAIGAAAGTFTINGGTIDNTSGAAVTLVNHPLTIDADITFTGSNDLNLGAGATTLGTAEGTARTFTTNAGALRLGGVIAGGSTAIGINKAGIGTLTLAGASTYTGLTTVSAGTLKLGASSGATTGPLGTTSTGTILENGASLDFAGFGVNVEPITISGTGVGGNGALVNSGGDQTNAVRFLTLAADASVGASGNRYDIRGVSAASPGTLDMAGHTLTKTGSGYVAIVNTTVTPGSGHIDIMGGSLGMHATNTLNGDATNTITLRTGAALDCYQSGTWNAPIWSVIMEAGSSFTNSNGIVAWDSTITLNGAANLGGTATLTLNGDVSGASGALTKTGAGTLNLNGTAANTYAGPTTVSAGTLALGKSAGVNAVSGDIAIDGGGVSLQADHQIPDGATVTLTTATSKFNINTKTETIANLDIQNASNIDSQGLLTGGSPGGKLTITGTLTHMAGNITLNSSGAGNSSTIDANAVINNGGSWTFGITDGTQKLIVGPGGLTIGNGSTIAVNALASTADNFISLGGNVTSTAAATSNVLSGAGSINLNGTRTFTVADGAAASDLEISAILANGSGTGSVVKEGAGTLTLAGAHTYTGATTITAGTLALGATGSVANSTSFAVAAGAKLDATAKSSFTFLATVTLGINGTSAISGLIDATGKELVISGATVNFDETGILTAPVYVLANYATISGTAAFASVESVSGYNLVYDYNGGTQIALVKAAAGGYAGWASENGVTGGAEGDDDGDGIKNLMEYALGLDAKVPGGSPGTFSNNILSFTKGTGVTGVTYAIETSATLNGDWAVVFTSPANDTTVSYSLPTGQGKIFARLKVTQP